MRVICISDTRGGHHALTPILPPGDVLLHAGNFTDLGLQEEIRSLNDWLGTLPYRHRLVVAGRHDTASLVRSQYKAPEFLSNATYRPNAFRLSRSA